MSSARATKRCAAAAAGLGLVFASFAGAAAATATTHHSPASHRITPNINPVPAGITAAVAAPVNLPLVTAQAGTATTLPTVTITDPGIIATTNVVTLTLDQPGGQFDFGLTSTVPTVTPTGAGVSVSTPVVNAGAGTIKFTVTKTTAGTAATYAVAGATVSGGSNTVADKLDLGVDVGTSVTQSSVASLDLIGWGAITAIFPAAYGETAPDTAALLFRDAVAADSPTAAVLASDYEPQDAESADYLASALSGGNHNTGVLLTDPTALSPAVTSALSDYSTITTVYIVGGTSVVSAAVQSQLKGDGYTVIRLAGTDQYDTNSLVVRYVAQSIPLSDPNLAIDYTQTKYDDTSGASSPTTTLVGSVKTAIIASGGADSYQDGIVAGPLSFYYGMPVLLTTPGSLSATALSALTEGSYKQVIVLGGPAAVSDTVVSQLTASIASGGAGVTAFRVAGTDASDTSTKFAAFLIDGPTDYYTTDDDGTTGVVITRGNGFQDALVAGPYEGTTGFTPILLTENATTLGAPLTAYLRGLAASDGIFAIQALGGPLSVTPAVQAAANAAQFSGLTP